MTSGEAHTYIYTRIHAGERVQGEKESGYARREKLKLKKSREVSDDDAAAAAAEPATAATRRIERNDF